MLNNSAFKEVFGTTRQVVAERFPEMAALVVGFFFFLRFLCPALVTPFTHGIVDGLNIPSFH